MELLRLLEYLGTCNYSNKNAKIKVQCNILIK